MEWNPIEVAPKDGTEIIGWRSDCGILLIRFTAMAYFLTESEIEKLEKQVGHHFDEAALFEENWFYADFLQGGRLESDEVPTHWMPLPAAPVLPE